MSLLSLYTPVTRVTTFLRFVRIINAGGNVAKWANFLGHDCWKIKLNLPTCYEKHTETVYARLQWFDFHMFKVHAVPLTKADYIWKLTEMATPVCWTLWLFSILAIRHTILICRHAAGAFIEPGPHSGPRVSACVMFNVQSAADLKLKCQQHVRPSANDKFIVNFPITNAKF